MFFFGLLDLGVRERKWDFPEDQEYHGATVRLQDPAKGHPGRDKSVAVTIKIALVKDKDGWANKWAAKSMEERFLFHVGTLLHEMIRLFLPFLDPCELHSLQAAVHSGA